MPTKKKKKKPRQRVAIQKVSNDNVKSFMKMNDDMNTAVFGFAQELKNRNTQISPTQLLTQSLKYLKTYATSYGLSMETLATKVSVVADKNYNVTSSEILNILQKEINAEMDLTDRCNKEMRKQKAKRTKVKKAGYKKAAKKRKSGKKKTTTEKK
jgi:hypothetical protein